jgi:nucleotide-binding universal stress UspA family protein
MSGTPVILVPTGFSDQSLVALEQALSFAKRINGRIVLLSVIEEDKGLLSFLYEDKSKMTEAREKMGEKLDELAEQYSKSSGVAIETMISAGVVYEEVVEVADMVRAKFIIMGTDGAPKGFRKKVIGSNAYRVVTMSHCPVISINGKENNPGIKNIILPLDLQKETKQKVGKAIELARLFDAKVHVISAYREKDDNVINHLQKNMAQVIKYLKKHDVEVVYDMLKALPDEEIHEVLLNYANEQSADLVMVMTQQESNFTDYFIGSLAQSMIYHSQIPIMSIHPKQNNSIYTEGAPGFGI